MSRFLVTETRVIRAPKAALFETIATPAMHQVIDGSGTVKAATENPHERLRLGSTFGMNMQLGAKYAMANTVTEFEEGARIAWQPKGGYTWRYTFTPADSGTLVTEEWDARGVKRRYLMALLGFPSRNRKGIIKTLERLAKLHEETPRGL